MTYLSIQDDYIYRKIYKNVYDECMRELEKRANNYFEVGVDFIFIDVDYLKCINRYEYNYFKKCCMDDVSCRQILKKRMLLRRMFYCSFTMDKTLQLIYDFPEDRELFIKELRRYMSDKGFQLILKIVRNNCDYFDYYNLFSLQ